MTPTDLDPGRAETSEQKRAVLRRILVAWEKAPTQRLGQLIVNSGVALNQLYGVSDDSLARLIEVFAEGLGKA